MKFCVSFLSLTLMLLCLSFEQKEELKSNEIGTEQQISNEVVDLIDFDDFKLSKLNDLSLNTEGELNEYTEIETETHYEEIHEDDMVNDSTDSVHEFENKRSVIKEVTIQASPKGMVETTRIIDIEGNEKIEVRLLESEESYEEDGIRQFHMIADEIARDLSQEGLVKSNYDKNSEYNSDQNDNNEEFDCDEEKLDNSSRPSADEENTKEYIRKRNYEGPKVTIKDIPSINKVSEESTIELESYSFFNLFLLICLLSVILIAFLRLTRIGQTFFEESEVLGWMKIIYSARQFNNKSL